MQLIECIEKAVVDHHLVNLSTFSYTSKFLFWEEVYHKILEHVINMLHPFAKTNAEYKAGNEITY